MLMNLARRSVVALAGCAIVAMAATTGRTGAATTAEDGIVKVRSAYSVSETIDRLERDVVGKKLMFFGAIDVAKLAAAAGVKLRPSTLLMFGNPALGAQFLTSNPDAGIDWPVRVLVIEDAAGQVWTIYTDFAWIAHRHRIEDRGAAFKMAAEVVASITASVTAK